MTIRHGKHKIMSLASSAVEADDGCMTLIEIPPANRAHTIVDRRVERRSAGATPVQTWSRRMASAVGGALRDRRPMTTLSETVLADFHGVRSVQR